MTTTAFEEALKTKVGDEEEMDFFTPFLRKEVAPFLIQRQGSALAARLIADMMAARCIDAWAFRKIEAGAGKNYTSKTKHAEIVIEMIRDFVRKYCQRKVEILYKETKSSAPKKIEVVPLDQWTLTDLDKVIRTAVKESLADIKYTTRASGGGLSEVDLTDEILQDFLQSGDDLLLVTAVNEQKDFALYTEMSDALKVCATDVEVMDDIGVALMFDPYDLEPEDKIRRREIGGEIQHAHVTLEKLKPIAPLAAQGLEATTRLYIDPVLLAAARIVGDFKLNVQKNIAGRRAKGPVDYIFTFEEKIICVTEAKYQKLKEGLAQNVAQMAVVREMRRKKRKIDFISREEMSLYDDLARRGGDFGAPIFGITTTAKEWIFSALFNNTLRVSEKIEMTNDEQLKRVISLVSGLLAAGKAD